MKKMDKSMTGKYTFLTENLLMIAELQEGELISSQGCTVKAEQVELNHVKVIRGDKEEYIQLSDKVRWMPEGEFLN